MPRYRPASRCLLRASLALLGAACGEAGLASPKDPGTVRVRVRDELAAPVPGASVRVQMPNSSGGMFEVGTTTRADGSATITAVPAGLRRVTVLPPAGYAAGPEPLTRVVEVTRGQTAEADFGVRRAATAAERGVAGDVARHASAIRDRRHPRAVRSGSTSSGVGRAAQLARSTDINVGGHVDDET